MVYGSMLIVFVIYDSVSFYFLCNLIDNMCRILPYCAHVSLKKKRSTFVGSAWSFGLFIPATTANDFRLRNISTANLIHYIYLPILILEKEPAFPFSMLSAKQVNYWYHFYNVFGMTRSLTGD